MPGTEVCLRTIGNWKNRNCLRLESTQQTDSEIAYFICKAIQTQRNVPGKSDTSQESNSKQASDVNKSISNTSFGNILAIFTVIDNRHDTHAVTDYTYNACQVTGGRVYTHTHYTLKLNKAISTASMYRYTKVQTGTLSTTTEQHCSSASDCQHRPNTKTSNPASH